MNDETNPPTRTDSGVDPDLVTPEPGSHPVGTGLGAAGGAAAGVAIGAIGGPIGAAVGGAIGAVAGGLTGHGVAESVDPTAEDAYWRSNYRNQDYASGNEDYEYEDYQPAYRTGYMGYAAHGGSGRTYEQAEGDLKSDWENTKGNTRITWDKAKMAARDAWNRVESSAANASGRTGDHPAAGDPTVS